MSRKSFAMISWVYSTIIHYLIFSHIVEDSIAAEKDSAVKRLELLTIVHRHGERTPYKFFKNDPYSDPKYWPDGEIQLIKTGRQRMYQLGKSIRENYNNFLEDNPRQVYARSSDADRCIESSELVLHGIFKSKGPWFYSNDTDYLPIPIHTVPTALDGMLTIDCDCPESSQEKLRLLNSKTAKQVTHQYSDTLNLIREKTGNDLSNLNDISDFYTTLTIEEENIKDFKRPDWYTDKVKEELRIMSDNGLYISSSSFEILRLRTSNFFADLRHRMHAKISGDSKLGGLKFLSYSTHDNLLASILIALDIFDHKVPPYGATLVFELIHVPSKGHFVQIYYWKDTEKEADLMSLPFCNNQMICSYDRFSRYISTYIVDDWQAACGLKHEPSLWSSGIFVALVAILALIIVIGLVWFMAIQWYGVRRQYEVIRS